MIHVLDIVCGKIVQNESLQMAAGVEHVAHIRSICTIEVCQCYFFRSTLVEHIAETASFVAFQVFYRDAFCVGLKEQHVRIGEIRCMNPGQYERVRFAVREHPSHIGRTGKVEF